MNLHDQIIAAVLCHVEQAHAHSHSAAETLDRPQNLLAAVTKFKIDFVVCGIIYHRYIFKTVHLVPTVVFLIISVRNVRLFSATD